MRQWRRIRNQPLTNLGNWERGGRARPNSFRHENELMDFGANLWKAPGGLNKYWGCCEANGTIANLLKVRAGKAALIEYCPKLVKKDAEGDPTVLPIILASKQGHYSIKSAAATTGLKVHTVASNSDSSIDIDALKEAVEQYPDRPIYMFLTTGTTVVQGRDNLRRAMQVAADTGRPAEHFYFDCDAAYDGVSLVLLRNLLANTLDAHPNRKVSRRVLSGVLQSINSIYANDEKTLDALTRLIATLPADFSLDDITPDFSLEVKSASGQVFRLNAISTSTHKFMGAIRPGGIVMLERAHSDLIAVDIEYIVSSHKTAGGTRDGSNVYEAWHIVKYFGTDEMTDWALACVLKAADIAEIMRHDGVKNVTLNPLATTVHFPEVSKELMETCSLAPEGGFCHVIVTPSTLDKGTFGGLGSGELFLTDFLAERRGRPLMPASAYLSDEEDLFEGMSDDEDDDERTWTTSKKEVGLRDGR
ncbi:pyridoxal-dependent decarboxylase [Rhizobium ruizarguesonis]